MSKAALPEITPEMIDAGRDGLRLFLPDAEEAMDHKESADLVKAIYVKMIMLDRTGRQDH